MAESIPSTIRAVVGKAKTLAAIETVPTPQLRDDYVLVKTTAYAVNPSDWKIAASGDAEGATLGIDYAGVVVKVGNNLTKSFAPGDRIAGFVCGNDTKLLGSGAFADYIVAKTGVQIKIPSNVSEEEAATLGAGVTTVGQGLYQTLKLPLPNNTAAVAASRGTPILIYGGSTATGLLGIQFAKLSGFRVIATCSPRNFEYLRSLGADEVFDHSQADWPARVHALTGGKLRYAWDCISSDETARACAEAMDRDEPGALYANLDAAPRAAGSADGGVGGNPKVKDLGGTVAYTVFGEEFEKIGYVFPAKPEDYVFGTEFWQIAEDLLAGGRLKTARPFVDRGGEGLEGVLVGLEELKAGRVSGGKLVYHATPAPQAS